MNFKLKLNISLQELILSLGLMSNLIAYILGDFSLSKYLLIFFTFAQVLMLVTVNMKLRLPIKFITVFSSILFLFYVSKHVYDYPITSTYLSYFLLYSSFSFVSLQYSLKLENIIKSFSLFLFLTSFFPIKLIFSNNDIGYLLGVSYNFLPGFLASLYLLIYKAKKTYFTSIYSFFNLLVYGFFFFYKGNRGVLLLILIYILLKWFLSGDKSFIVNLKKFLIIVGSVFVSMNLISILSAIHRLFSQIGIDFYALTKTIDLLSKQENLDSGRFYLINRLFGMVQLEELTFGKGIGFIEEALGIYSHNLFVQYLFEGGVIYLTFSILLILKLFKLLNNSLHQEFILIVLCSIFGQLLLSNVYWLNPIYWFVIYFLTFVKGASQKYGVE